MWCFPNLHEKQKAGICLNLCGLSSASQNTRSRKCLQWQGLTLLFIYMICCSDAHKEKPLPHTSLNFKMIHMPNLRPLIMKKILDMKHPLHQIHFFKLLTLSKIWNSHPMSEWNVPSQRSQEIYKKILFKRDLSTTDRKALEAAVELLLKHIRNMSEKNEISAQSKMVDSRSDDGDKIESPWPEVESLRSIDQPQKNSTSGNNALQPQLSLNLSTSTPGQDMQIWSMSKPLSVKDPAVKPSVQASTEQESLESLLSIQTEQLSTLPISKVQSSTHSNGVDVRKSELNTEVTTSHSPSDSFTFKFLSLAHRQTSVIEQSSTYATKDSAVEKHKDTSLESSTKNLESVDFSSMPPKSMTSSSLVRPTETDTGMFFDTKTSLPTRQTIPQTAHMSRTTYASHSQTKSDWEMSHSTFETFKISVLSTTKETLETSVSITPDHKFVDLHQMASTKAKLETQKSNAFTTTNGSPLLKNDFTVMETSYSPTLVSADASAHSGIVGKATNVTKPLSPELPNAVSIKAEFSPTDSQRFSSITPLPIMGRDHPVCILKVLNMTNLQINRTEESTCIIEAVHLDMQKTSLNPDETVHTSETTSEPTILLSTEGNSFITGTSSDLKESANLYYSFMDPYSTEPSAMPYTATLPTDTYSTELTAMPHTATSLPTDTYSTEPTTFHHTASTSFTDLDSPEQTALPHNAAVTSLTDAHSPEPPALPYNTTFSREADSPAPPALPYNTTFSTETESPEPLALSYNTTFSTEAESPEPLALPYNTTFSTETESPEPPALSYNTTFSTEAESPEPLALSYNTTFSTEAESSEPLALSYNTTFSTEAESPEPLALPYNTTFSTETESPEPPALSYNTTFSTEAESPEPLALSYNTTFSTEAESSEPLAFSYNTTFSTEAESPEPPALSYNTTFSTEAESPEPLALSYNTTFSTEAESSEPLALSYNTTFSTETESPEPTESTSTDILMPEDTFYDAINGNGISAQMTAQSTSMGSSTAQSTSMGSSTAQSTSMGSSTAQSTSMGSSTAQSTSMASSTAQSTSMASSTAQSTSMASSTAQSTSMGSSTAQSTSMGSSTAQSTSMGSSTAQSTSMGSSTAQSTSMASSTAQSTSMASSTAQSTSMASSTAQSTSMASSTAQSTSMASSTAQSTSMASSTAQSTSMGSSTAQSTSMGSSTAQSTSMGSSTALPPWFNKSVTSKMLEWKSTSPKSNSSAVPFIGTQKREAFSKLPHSTEMSHVPESSDATENYTSQSTEKVSLRAKLTEVHRTDSAEQPQSREYLGTTSQALTSSVINVPFTVPPTIYTEAQRSSTQSKLSPPLVPKGIPEFNVLSTSSAPVIAVNEIKTPSMPTAILTEAMPLNFHLTGVSYSEQLADHTTEEYKKLEREVKLVLNKVLDAKYQQGYIGLRVVSFLKGSVAVKSDVVFDGRTSTPSASDLVRTILSDDSAVTSKFFEWRIDPSTIESKGVTAVTMDPESLTISFRILRVGFIILQNSQEKKGFLESLQKAVLQAIAVSFPITTVSLSLTRDVRGDLEVNGFLYLNSSTYTNVQELLPTLWPLANRSVDLSSIIVKGMRSELKIYPFNFRVTNKQFEVNLLNLDSLEFQKLSKDLSALVQQAVYSGNLLQVVVREFYSGSVTSKGDLIFRFPAPGSGEILRQFLRSLNSDGVLGSSEFKVDFRSVTIGDSSSRPYNEYIDFPGYGVAIIVMCGLSILIFPVLIYVCYKTRMLGHRNKAIIHHRRDPDAQSHHFEMDNQAFRSAIEQP